jgi:hypothetical protein|tara:strand:+ start:142 stop:531 length:390 start_codon:yes stop_codon:yes gene_type:complete
MKAKELLEKIYKEHNLEREDLYVDKRGFVIIKRTGIEKIQFQNNITAKFDVLKCDKDECVMKCTAETLDGGYIETHSSANNNNCTNKFYVETCEKRVLGRAVLKLCRIYEDGEVFSSDEIENQPPNTLN